MVKIINLYRTGMPQQHITQKQPQTQHQNQPPTPTKTKAQEGRGQGDQGQKKEQWPPKLKAFVEKAFEQCTDEEERKQVEAELKKIITKAIAENTLWEVDWDNEPMIEYVS